MSPVFLQLVQVVFGPAVALVLFWRLKHVMAEQARGIEACIEKHNEERNDERWQQLSSEVLIQLREGMRTATELAPRPAPSSIPLSGMNLNKRTQAMRLLRRGEDAGHVAAALGLPRGEVELLVRVQQMSAQRTAQAGPP